MLMELDTDKEMNGASGRGNAQEVFLHSLNTRSGGPQPVVFLHGVGRNHRTFLHVAEKLGPFWNPWLLDLRGHGASACGLETYFVMDYVADLVKWLEGRWQRGAVLYGHSLGAMVAAAVAAAVPEKVAAIVLEDPPFHTMGERMEGTFWQYYFDGLLEAIKERAGMFERLRQIRVPVNGDGKLGPLCEVRDADSLRFSAECLAEVDPAVFKPVASGQWLKGYNVEAVCQCISCPVYLLQGNPALGGALEDDDAALFRRASGPVHLFRFEDKGHQIHWPDPAGVIPVFQKVENDLKGVCSI